MKDSKIAKHLLFFNSNKYEMAHFGLRLKDIPESHICKDYLYIIVENILESISDMI